MRRILVSLGLLTMFVVGSQAQDWSSVFDKVVKENLVWITVAGEKNDLSCTGEVIGKDTVLTAAHCFTDNGKNLDVKVYMNSSAVYFRGQVKRLDAYIDLAIVSSVSRNKVPMKMAEHNPLPGQEVGMIGYHGDTSPIVFSSLVVSIPVSMKDSTDLQPVGHALMSGMSGGPMVNSDGELVGVDVATSHDHVVGFAVPIETVKAFLEDHK